MKKIAAAVLLAVVLLSACSAFVQHSETPSNIQPPISSSDDINDTNGDALLDDPIADTNNHTQGAAEQADIKEQNSSGKDYPEESAFSVHFIDVGQADAALVECDGHYMLIDGGNKADSDVIYTVLKNAGVSHLEMIVATHGHEDHIGGIPGALNYADADMTLCPVTDYDSEAFKDFAKYAGEKGGGIKVPDVGEKHSLGSAEITILGVNGGSAPNDTSIVLKIQYGDTSFLFTGDAEREAEQVILSSGADLSATVLKVGHHGSETSTTYPFLREIMPQYAVISVGKGNSYGHPDEDTLSRLRDADVQVFRTDVQGDIYCTSDGKNVKFTTERNAGVDTLETVNDTEPVPPDADVTENDQTENEIMTEMVWIPVSGSKYHSYAGCSNMKNPTQVTEEEAIERGFTPCKKCW